MKCKRCWGTGREPDHVALGREARRYRQDLYVSLRARARELGVTPSMLSALETGKRTWTEELFNRATKP